MNKTKRTREPAMVSQGKSLPLEGGGETRLPYLFQLHHEGDVVPLLRCQLPVGRDDPQPPWGLPRTLLWLGGVLFSHAVGAVIGHHLPVPEWTKAQAVTQLTVIQSTPNPLSGTPGLVPRATDRYISHCCKD